MYYKNIKTNRYYSIRKLGGSCRVLLQSGWVTSFNFTPEDLLDETVFELIIPKSTFISENPNPNKLTPVRDNNVPDNIRGMS